MRKFLTISGISLLLIFAIGIEASYLHNRGTVNQPIIQPVTVDPRLLASGTQLGLTTTQLASVHAQFGAGPCGEVFKAAYAGCYDSATRTVYIKSDLSATRTTDVLAYEYMHDVWERQITPVEQTQLRRSLNSLYQQNQAAFDHRMTTVVQYEGKVGSSSWYDELHSMVCTEINDNHLPTDILNHCNQYLPHREITTRYY